MADETSRLPSLTDSECNTLISTTYSTLVDGPLKSASWLEWVSRPQTESLAFYLDKTVRANGPFIG